MKHVGLTALGLYLWGALSLVTSCGGNSESTGTDSNTHWLKDCDADGDCGALSCVCGVCTKSCDDSADCQPFGSDAACEVPSDCGSANGPAACVRETPSNGGSGAGGAGSGSSAGSGGRPADPECPPMDARGDDPTCGSVIGYAYDGGICGPVYCSCQGADCDNLFNTMQACDHAYYDCYAKVGMFRGCVSHEDCNVRHRTCCWSCEPNDIDSLFAVAGPSPSPKEAGVCLGDSTFCDDCAEIPNPAIYAACVLGECQLLDVSDEADCDSDDDCSFRLKDCCGCREAAAQDLISVNSSFFRPDYCPLEMSCVACTPPLVKVDNVFPACNLQYGECELVVTTN
jgi:hypothetical protein